MQHPATFVLWTHVVTVSHTLQFKMPPKKSPKWNKPSQSETNAVVDKFLGQFEGKPFPKHFDYKKGVGQQALGDFKELVKNANNGVCAPYRTRTTAQSRNILPTRSAREPASGSREAVP